MADKPQIDERLERIFHPYVAQHTENFAKKQRDPSLASFVHYTSAEAALHILETKQIWMRNATGMPDVSELKQGFGLINDVLFRDAGGVGWKELSEALDDCAPGSAAKALEVFNKLWNDIQYNTYVTSISEHDASEDQHGRLSMWRAFGESVRVAMVFKFPFALLQGDVFNLVISPVAYLSKEEVAEQFQTVLQNIRDNRDFLKSVGSERLINSVYNALVAGVTCLKHEGFKEEREWRLIYAPNRWPSKLIKPSTEVIRGIPQIVYKIPFDGDTPDAPEGLKRLDLVQIFDHLIIGPAIYPFSMVEAFVSVLQKIGVSNLEKRIVFSGIPIRF